MITSVSDTTRFGTRYCDVEGVFKIFRSFIEQYTRRIYRRGGGEQVGILAPGAWKFIEERKI